MKLKLVLTCGACPEQYDVYDETEKVVGYLRLRHGRFYAQYIDNNWSDIVYEASTRGDGIFDSNERDYHLKWAVHHLIDRIQNGPRDQPPAPDVEYEVVGNADEWAHWDTGDI